MDAIKIDQFNEFLREIELAREKAREGSAALNTPDSVAVQKRFLSLEELAAILNSQDDPKPTTDG